MAIIHVHITKSEDIIAIYKAETAIDWSMNNLNQNLQ